jgi:hypothetical protein
VGQEQHQRQARRCDVVLALPLPVLVQACQYSFNNTAKQVECVLAVRLWCC